MRKKQFTSWVGGLLICLLVSPFGIAADSLSQRMAANFDQLPQGPHWGLWVKDLTTNENLYARRDREFFTPASTMKLLTAAAAVDSLPLDFRFHTRLGWNAKVINGELKGDLYLYMGGDPTLTTADLIGLFNRLKLQGIHSIQGKLLVDTSRYQMTPYGPGWMWDELSYGYAAPMGSIVIDENKFAIKISPVKNSVHPEIGVGVPTGAVHINNQVEVTTKYEKSCPLTVYSNDSNQYRLGGCLVSAWGPQVRVLAIRNPWPLLVGKIRSILQQENIVLHQAIQRSQALPGVHWQLTHESEPLPELMKNMLKESNNLIADALFVELGRHYSPDGGNWQGGAVAVEHFLQDKVKINTDAIRIEDGSGISRYNLIRPIQLGKLLCYIHQHPQLYDVIYPSLPIAGKDGTLMWRMRQSFALSRVHAKTGSMTGVSALAGFIKRKDGHELAFVITMNGWIGKLKKWRVAEDRLLIMLTSGKQ